MEITNELCRYGLTHVRTFFSRFLNGGSMPAFFIVLFKITKIYLQLYLCSYILVIGGVLYATIVVIFDTGTT